MKEIVITLPPNLPQKWGTIAAKRKSAVAAKKKRETRSAYISKRPSWNVLKRWLSERSNGKCWYCECKSLRAPFDVDHFRPKLEVTIDGVVLTGHEGYHWLAYEWTNFRLSCQRCNRPEKTEDGNLCGKANEFPLKSELRRCTTRKAPVSTEEPKLLDPREPADCLLLAHVTSGEVKSAAAAGTWESMRACYTIALLGFNKWGAPEAKRTAWQTVDLLIHLTGEAPAPDVVDVLKKRLSDDWEYSSFWRASIATHRDKAWVSSLL